MDKTEIRMRCLEVAQHMATKFVLEDRSRITDIAEDFFTFVINEDKVKKTSPKKEKAS